MEAPFPLANLTMTLLLPALLAGLVLSNEPAPLLPTSPVRAGGDEVEDVEALLVDCEAFGWSGTVHIQRGKKVLLNRGFGLADDESGRACEPDTRFEIASVTKPIVAAAILALVEANKVHLDVPISAYLPGVPEHSKGITVRHLLVHSSGMTRSGPSGHGTDLEAAVAKYLSEPPATDPGDAFQYWNGGYALLAGIIEEQSGKSFEDYLRSRVFKKAGMRSAGFTGDELPEKEQARGYQPGAADRWASDHPYGSYGWQYKGMGGIVTGAEGLAKFMHAYAAGKIIDRDLVLEAIKPAGKQHRLHNRCLGWEVNWDFPSRSYRIEHGGSVRGFQSSATFVLGTNLSIVLLSNRGGCPIHWLGTNARLLAMGEQAREDQPLLPPATIEWKKGKLQELVGDWVSKDAETLTLAAKGPRSLTATASVVLTTGDGERSAVSSQTIFATTSKEGLQTHGWSGKPGKDSELVWNGLKGAKAHLQLTDPHQKKIIFKRK